MTPQLMPRGWPEGYWLLPEGMSLSCCGSGCGAELEAGTLVYCTGEPGEVWCRRCSPPVGDPPATHTRGPARRVSGRIGSRRMPNGSTRYAYRLRCGHVVERTIPKMGFCYCELCPEDASA